MSELEKESVIEEIQVTSIRDLKTYAKGKIVTLPHFADGQPFNARLIRPSMLALVKQKKIPNALLSSANELFKSGGSNLDTDDSEMMDNIFSVMDIICEASFSEPTYQQIKDAGIVLSDEQMMFVFSYSQEGVKALSNFR